MDLFITKTDGWSLPDGTPMNRKVASGMGLVEGLPFFLTSDGRYDEHLNGWLRWLCSEYHSRHTWIAYARDVMRFVRFLEAVAKDRGLPAPPWYSATSETLREYHFVRRVDPNSGVSVNPSTWNRELAALQSLFDYALQENLITELPFRFRSGRLVVPTGSGLTPRAFETRSNELAARTRRRAPGYKSVQEYLDFKFVGLGGKKLNPNVAARAKPGLRYVEDPTFSGRHSVRNVLLADLLITTGMRRSEAISLLLWELPVESKPLETKGIATRELEGAPRPPYRDVEVQLAAAVCKGRVNPRPVYIPRAVYRRVHRYVGLERDHNVSARRGRDGRGPYRPSRRPIFAELAGNGQYRTPDVDRPLRMDETDAHTRRRLVETVRGVPMGPAQLFVSEGGLATDVGTLNAVFATASARCTRLLGCPTHVHPHDLRHTYAVNMLQHLIKHFLDISDLKELRKKHALAAYHRIARDPIRILMRRLGHIQMESTFLYLQYLDEVLDAPAEASARFAHELGLDEEGEA